MTLCSLGDGKLEIFGTATNVYHNSNYQARPRLVISLFVCHVRRLGFPEQTTTDWVD